VIRCLKEQCSHAEIHYLTKPAYEGILASNPYIDRLHLLKPALKGTIQELRSIHFDHIIDLHHNFRTWRIKAALRVHSSSFNKLNLKKWIYVNLMINRMPPVHIVDRYLETVAFLGVKNDGKGLDYFIGKTYQLSELLPATHQRYTALVIGAQHATKRLPQHKLIELCQMLNHPIVLLGGPEDKARAEEIVRNSGDHVFNGC